MNQIETNLKTCIINAVKQALTWIGKAANVVIEIPKEKIHGDYSTNAAMRLTKQLRQNPQDDRAAADRSSGSEARLSR